MGQPPRLHDRWRCPAVDGAAVRRPAEKPEQQYDGAVEDEVAGGRIHEVDFQQN